MIFYIIIQMPSKIDNNALIHDYLIPLIKYVNFSECENPTQMKRLIAKLMTIAKKSMKANNDPSDMSVIDPSNMSVMENVELSPAIVIAQSKAGLALPISGTKKKPTKVVKKIVNPKDSEGSDDESDDDDSDDSKKTDKTDKTDDKKTVKKAGTTKIAKTEKTAKKTIMKKAGLAKPISPPTPTNSDAKDSDDDEDDEDDEIKITSIVKKETNNDSEMEDPISDDE